MLWCRDAHFSQCAGADAGMMSMPTGMPALSDGSGSGPRVLEPDEAFPSTAENDPHYDSHHEGHQHNYGLGPHHDTKTKRNAKQQMQNKQAQQRYRERRKQRFTEMEQQVKVLTNQLQDQASLRRQNNALLVCLHLYPLLDQSFPLLPVQCSRVASASTPFA